MTVDYRALTRFRRAATVGRVSVPPVLVCLCLAGGVLAASPGTAAAAADTPCMRYAPAPERVRGGDDNTPDTIRTVASAVSCPNDVWVQITACLQIQAGGGWSDVRCATSRRSRITVSTRGARGQAVAFDAPCVTGVLRTHVTGGEGLEPTEWDSPSASIVCNVHDVPADTTPPTTTIVSGPAALSRDPSPSFGFTSSEASTFECRLDAPGWTVCTSPAAFGPRSDGEYTFHVRATDAAGNIGTEETSTFTIDTTPPPTSIDSGPSGTVTGTDASFTFSSEPGASLECRLDDAAWARCTSPATYAGLGVGAHGFGARATDAAGNVGPETTRTWTIAASPGETGTPAPSATSTREPAPATAALAVGARDTTAPRLSVAAHRRALTVTRAGVVDVLVGMLQEDASGTLALRAPAVLGRTSFTAPAGHPVVVRVRLSRSGSAALRRRHRLAVRATVTLRDAAGNASATTFALALKPARS